MHNPFLEAERINKSMETALPWPPEVMEEMKAHVAEYHTERARFTALETKLAKEEKRPVDHAKINTYIAAHMQLYVTEKAQSNRHSEEGNCAKATIHDRKNLPVLRANH